MIQRFKNFVCAGFGSKPAFVSSLRTKRVVLLILGEVHLGRMCYFLVSNTEIAFAFLQQENVMDTHTHTHSTTLPFSQFPLFNIHSPIHFQLPRQYNYITLKQWLIHLIWTNTHKDNQRERNQSKVVCIQNAQFCGRFPANKCTLPWFIVNHQLNPINI